MNHLRRPQPYRLMSGVIALAVMVAAGDVKGQATTEPASQGSELQERSPIQMTRPDTFTVNFQGIDLRLALRLLSLQGKKNIIATKEVSGTVTAVLYDVTFKEALNAVLQSSGFVSVEEGNFVYVYTPKQMAEILKAQRKMLVRTFKLAYITATDAKTLIIPAMSSEGTVATTPASDIGIDTSKTEAGGNSLATIDVLIVKDYEEELDDIAAILKEVDVRPEQVLIEATILRATLTEENSLGVDFNALAGIDFETLNSTSAGLTSITPGTLASNELPLDAAATFRTDFTSAIGAGGLTIGFVGNELSFFIRALEGVTDVTVLANPKLLVINKQRGEVMIGNRDGYLTTTVTETVATQTVEFLETGTRLVVRPFIGRDGYIRMELHPEDSSGSVAQVGNNVLPSETTTEVTSNVLVRDGHTIVIGGLFRERTSNARSQVPFFGNLPIIGEFMRQTTDMTSREEVIILVTPRIIQNAADEATSEQIKQDVERFRIGQREGLRWWGRSRLAQTHMRWAKNDIRNGRRWLALWNVDLALALEPRMDEAIHLRERISDKAYWANQSRHSATKYIIQRMIMQEMGKPVDSVIMPDRPRDGGKLDEETKRAFNIRSRPEVQLPPPPKPWWQWKVKSKAPPADKKSGGNAPGPKAKDAKGE